MAYEMRGEVEGGRGGGMGRYRVACFMRTGMGGWIVCCTFYAYMYGRWDSVSHVLCVQVRGTK